MRKVSSKRAAVRGTALALVAMGLGFGGPGSAAAGEPFGSRADAVSIAAAHGISEVVRPARAVSAARTVVLQTAPEALAALALEARIADLFARNLATPAEIDALLGHYAARAFAPRWTDAGGLTPAGRRIADWLGTAADDGLDPADYPTPRLTRLGAANLDRRAEAEVTLALSIMRYGGDAQAGTIEPGSVNALVDVEVTRPSPAAVLAAVAAAEDPALALDAFNPPHAGYRNLRRALMSLNEADRIPLVQVPPGRTLRRGIADPRVVLLRERLGLLEQGDASDPGRVFDAGVEAAVRDFQAENGLLADGIVGPRTLAALNADTSATRAQIVANMERWRWLPRDLGSRYVHVNIPEFRVWVREGLADGEGYETSYTGRVVVGTPVNPTPVFSDEIEHVVTNPYWNVPYSIASGEMLPNLKRDATYYARRGYDTLTSGGKIVDPTRIDWSAIAPNKLRYRFRQRPSKSNALGNVKFLFPNEHAVYLHDTNARSLFSRAVRAFSHGCVRLHEPFAFADALLKPDPDLSGETIRASLGPKERWFNTAEHIPVHITYFTVGADEGGSLNVSGDIYGFDRRVQRLMGLI